MLEFEVKNIRKGIKDENFYQQICGVSREMTVIGLVSKVISTDDRET